MSATQVVIAAASGERSGANNDQAGTLSANPVAMAAGIAQIKACLAPDFYKNLGEKASHFIKNLNTYLAEKEYPVKFISVESIFWIAFTKNETVQAAHEIDGSKMEFFKRLHGELLENGVYLGPSGYEVGFVSAAHTTADLEKVTAILCRAFDKVFAEVVA